MAFWYLLILGLVLIGHHMGLFGIIAIVVALFASNSTRATVSLVVGIILLITQGWLLAGILGIVAYLVHERR